MNNLLSPIKYALLLILLLYCSNLCAQTPNDSLEKYLKTEHDSNAHCYKPNSSGKATGQLLVLVKKDTLTMYFDSGITNLFHPCWGDIDYYVCWQTYSSYSSTNELFHYETFGVNNRILLSVDGILYQAGDEYRNFFDTSAMHLVDGIAFTYKYEASKKYLVLTITKRVKLEVNFNGHKLRTIMEEKHLSVKQTKRKYKPITLLPGSSIIFCIDESSRL